MAEVFAHDAMNFYEQGMHELDKRVLGEQAAKVGVLVSYVTGLNLALVGEPGGGKTTLSSEAYRLIDDISEENVARVPHHSDLTPQQLIGGSVTTTREVTDERSTRTEKTTSKIKPIIHPDTQVIWIDELNRVNPFAVNGVLGALENGKITTDAGEVQLKGLELAISTMNPTETRQATFPVAAATASRHAIGVLMGAEKQDPQARGMLMDELLGGWEPGNINPVISLAGLHDLRDKAATLALPTSTKQLAKQLISGAVDVLADHGLREADARVTKHVASIARGLALLNGEERVMDDNLRQAVRYVMTARLGIMGVRGGNLHAAINDTVGSVINKG